MIFSQFTADDIVVGRINQVSSGLFGSGSLYLSQSAFTTSSAQANTMIGANQFDVRNGQYYTNVYAGGDLYFSIAYGDYANTGSSKYDSTVVTAANRVLTNETKVIYSQYRNTLLQPGDNFFSFASGSVSTPQDSQAIFVMNFASDKIKDQIDPGQIQINFLGTNGQYSFIDDSSVVNKQQSVYNLISGSVVNGVPTPYTKNNTVAAVYEGIGLFYPTNGVVVFNAINLDKRVGITNPVGQIVDRANNSNNNSTTFQSFWRVWTHDLFLRIKKSTKPMAVRKSEFVPSTNYFVRVKNKEFNYSNNPTFVSDGTDSKTKGTIVYQDLINNPRTYITGVGLYDANNELIAIGKVSRPVQKSFDSELLLKVRIDF
jgi:hypothetical protein